MLTFTCLSPSPSFLACWAGCGQGINHFIRSLVPSSSVYQVSAGLNGLEGSKLYLQSFIFRIFLYNWRQYPKLTYSRTPLPLQGSTEVAIARYLILDGFLCPDAQGTRRSIDFHASAITKFSNNGIAEEQAIRLFYGRSAVRNPDRGFRSHRDKKRGVEMHTHTITTITLFETMGHSPSALGSRIASPCWFLKNTMSPSLSTKVHCVKDRQRAQNVFYFAMSRTQC